MTPVAFAGNSEITVVPVAGSKDVGCEDLDGCYTPSIATIDVGGKVIFSNTDSVPHTFTGGNAYDGTSDKFDSGLLQAGESETLDTTGFELGEYDYFCLVHPWMLGILVIQEAEEVPVVIEPDPVVIEPDPVVIEPDPVVSDPAMNDPVVSDPAMNDPDPVVIEPDPAVPSTPTEKDTDKEGTDDSGCLIATAAYGTELAPQVQMLREIRDNTLFSTASGTAFMSGFNTLYYSFAPTVSDWERENPMFKEAVKVMITPMLSTLSIMSLADEGSEAKVLGLGISVIALNLAMYVGIPVFGILKIYQIRKD